VKSFEEVATMAHVSKRCHLAALHESKFLYSLTHSQE